MAWVDDRIWCHPKFTDLSPKAAWVWVKGVAYATGFQTHGFLTAGQQAVIGSDPRVRRELLDRGLWEDHGSAVCIHDWDDHNAKRDARREAERTRLKRRRERLKNAGQNAGQTRVDGSDGSD